MSTVDSFVEKDGTASAPHGEAGVNRRSFLNEAEWRENASHAFLPFFFFKTASP